MKNTMIKKFNVVISLWLIAVMATLIVFGTQLANNGFYIAAMVVGVILLAINVFTIVSGITSASKKAASQQRSYRKY